MRIDVLMPPPLTTLLIALLVLAGCLVGSSGPEPTINAVIGDESYRALTGREPGPELDEDARITIHLAYVERHLRVAPADHLSPALRQARARNLARLRQYIEAGAFPRNDDHPDARRPTFVDDQGRICAVGHLMARDLGTGTVVALAPSIKYHYIADIDLPAFEGWARDSGLTRRELAMIQPSYGWERPRPPRPPVRPPPPVEPPRPPEPPPWVQKVEAAFDTLEARVDQCMDKHLGGRQYPEPWLPVEITWDPRGEVASLDFQLRELPGDEAIDACIREVAPLLTLGPLPNQIRQFRLVKIRQRPADDGTRPT